MKTNTLLSQKLSCISKLSILITFSFIFLTSFPSFSQNQSKEYYYTKLKSNTRVGYLAYTPGDYKNNSDKYPLIIFLHGQGEVGSDLNKVCRNGPPRLIKNGKWPSHLPFIVISPQIPSAIGANWDPALVDEVIEQVKNKYRIDASRIYVTGFSLGGNGAWRYAAAYPNKVAAIVPMAGWGEINKACNVKNVPVWAFHGKSDGRISYTRTKSMVDAVNSCGGNAKGTYPSGVGHTQGLWETAYKPNHSTYNPNIYDWLITKKSGTSSTPNKAPVANAGTDKNLTLPDNSVMLYGSGRDDDGKIASYVWSKVSGPWAKMENSNSSELSLSNLSEGDYTFKLTVKDNNNATASDEVKVTVNGSTNKDPLANAGSDKNLTLPDNSVMLYGSARDDDGKIASYVWSKVSGPWAKMENSNSSNLSLSNLSEGDYTFKLTVKDDKNATASDQVKVTVNPSSAKLPNDSNNGLFYTYYEGYWSNAPDFNNLSARKEGIISNFSLDPKTRNDNFGFMFEGFIEIKNGGEYTFYTSSDDGSKLFIGTKEVVDNDGLHSLKERSGRIYLSPGKHPIKVVYFERSGGETLQVKYAGPGIGKQMIPNAVLSTDQEESNQEPSTSDDNPGLSYAYYEGYWSNAPDFNNLSARKEGTISNFSLVPKIRNNNFGFMFEGFIEIKNGGEYTFYTNSDDGSKLFIGTKEVVDNDGLHSLKERSGRIYLSPGKHPIKVVYFERSGGETLQVKYAGPGIGKQMIPNAVLSTDQEESNQEPSTSDDNPGLSYAYYEGYWSNAPDFNNLSARKEGTISNFSLDPKIRNNNFGFMFEGFIEIKNGGEYTFYTSSDDGSKLFIGTKEVVDNDGLHSLRERSGRIYLSPGKHPIKVVYFERSGDETLQVKYAGPGVGKQVVPNRVLYTKNSNNAYNGVLNNNDVATKATNEPTTNAIAYPNSIKEVLNIKFPHTVAKTVEITIIDHMGKIYLKELKEISSINNYLQVDLYDKKMSAGIYLLQLKYDTGENEVIRLLKD